MVKTIFLRGRWSASMSRCCKGCWPRDYSVVPPLDLTGMARLIASIPMRWPWNWPSAHRGQAHLHHDVGRVDLSGQIDPANAGGRPGRASGAGQGGFAPDIISKAQYASAACAAGVSRVHIINGRVDEALLAEVFSNEGIGTLFTPTNTSKSVAP